MAKKKNKKGEEGGFNFFGENLLGFVLSVCCLVVLIFIAVVVYNIFSEKSDLEKAGSNFKITQGEIDLVKNTLSANSGQIIVYFPLNWVLRSYSEGFPKTECYGKKSCLCTCQAPSCEGVQKVCEGFDYRVEISASYTNSNWYNKGPITYNSNTYPNTIAFTKAAEGLKIYKQEDKIIIEQVN